MMNALDISSSGLRAQRLRMNVIANNVANINTTRDVDGNPNPFRRQVTLFQEGGTGFGGKQGVQVPEIRDDDKAIRLVYNKNHPDANADGYVAMPNVELIEEMVDMIAATRAYEANVTAMDATKNMYTTALRIIA